MKTMSVHILDKKKLRCFSIKRGGGGAGEKVLFYHLFCNTRSELFKQVDHIFTVKV